MNTTKSILASLMMAIIVLVAFSGCDDNNNVMVVNEVPVPPQGVYSVTGDERVHVVFTSVYTQENDIDRYNVYRSLEPVDNYTFIGDVAALPNPDFEPVQYVFTDRDVSNGTTYYYAVTAVDKAGQESLLSYENVFDTPRPEGEVVLFATAQDPSRAGFDFVLGQYADTNQADVYVDIFDGILYLNAGVANTDLQDVGYTYPFSVDGLTTLAFDDVTYAPVNGWSQLGFTEIIQGHTYVIWTAANHFAKMRADVVNYGGRYVIFKWAYQTDEGNPELSVPGESPDHTVEYREKAGSSM
jgi:hypothetical protein